MSRMLGVFLGIFFVLQPGAAYASPKRASAASKEGFLEARWGMGRREVQKRVQGTVTDPQTVSVRKTVAGYPAGVFFRFTKADKLALAIATFSKLTIDGFDAIEGDAFRQARERLEEKYGTPAATDESDATFGDITRWETGETRISLMRAREGDIKVFVIKYESKAFISDFEKEMAEARKRDL